MKLEAWTICVEPNINELWALKLGIYLRIFLRQSHNFDPASFFFGFTKHFTFLAFFQVLTLSKSLLISTFTFELLHSSFVTVLLSYRTDFPPDFSLCFTNNLTLVFTFWCFTNHSIHIISLFCFNLRRVSSSRNSCDYLRFFKNQRLFIFFSWGAELNGRWAIVEIQLNICKKYWNLQIWMWCAGVQRF